MIEFWAVLALVLVVAAVATAALSLVRHRSERAPAFRGVRFDLLGVLAAGLMLLVNYIPVTVVSEEIKTVLSVIFAGVALILFTVGARLAAKHHPLSKWKDLEP